MTTIDTSKLDPNEAAGAASSADKAAPASCPLNANYLQLIPIRYAYVENLAADYNQTKNASANSSKPINNTSEKQPTELAEEDDDITPSTQEVTVYGGPHPIGYRFIRDGWLYTIDDNSQRLYEHVLKDGVIIQRTYKGMLTSPPYRDSYEEIEQEDGKELRLIFKKNHKIYISYSQVEWTDAKCKQMRKRAERKEFMQEIDLANVSCEHIGQHLLTREQAEQAIAEVAEEYQPPSYVTEFEEESTAYSWTATPFKKASIGKLTSQLKKEYEQQGNYLFVVVEDHIGMMLDLYNEQELVSKWLGDWSEKESNSLKYNVGNYIDSTLTITPQNAPQKGASQWISSLPEEKQQAIYDYVNEDIDFNQELSNLIEEMKKDGYSSNEIELAIMSEKYQQRQQVLNQKRQTMIDLLGQAEYQAHKDEIEALKENQELHYEGKFLGGRGVKQLVNLPKLKNYLNSHHEKHNRWQHRLQVITSVRTILYTRHYHKTTWYYDKKNEQQLEQVIQLGNILLQDIHRNDTSTKLLREFLDNNPYATFPAIQTIFTAEFLNTNLHIINKWFDDAANLYQTTIDPQNTKLQQLENAIANNNYWRQLLHPTGNIAELVEIHHLNLSPAINQSLSGFMEAISNPMLNEKGQARFNNALDRYKEMVTKMGPAARASFLLSINSAEGHVYISDSPTANAQASRALFTINNYLEKIQRNNATINAKHTERAILQDPGSQQSKQIRDTATAVKKLTREIDSLQKQNRQLQDRIENHQQRLAQLISPLGEGEKAAALSFRTSGLQEAAIKYERAALSAGIIPGGYKQGAAGFASVAKNTSLPTFILVFNLLNFSQALDTFFQDRAYDQEKLLPVVSAFFGTLAATASVWQTAHVALLNRVVDNINKMGTNLTGAQTLTKIGRLNIILGAAGQIFGGFVNYYVLFSTFSKWRDALLSGDTGKTTAAVMSLTGNLGNAGVSTYGLVHTTLTGRHLYRDFKAGQMAARTAWVVRGARYASVLGRVTPWGLFFTALQLGGELVYNYYDLSEVQQWFEKSCWGNKNKGWDQQQHNQQLAYALLKPILIDQGAQTIKGKTYRVIQAIFPGQLTVSLKDNPICWQAQWQHDPFEYPHIDTTIGETLRQQTVPEQNELVILQWLLPWLPQDQWSRAQDNVLLLRLFYTPEMADEPLGGKEYGLGYKISLKKWTNDAGETIKQVAGKDVRIRKGVPLIRFDGKIYDQPDQ